MFVKTRMTANPWTVRADATIPEAIALMKDKHVRHLPVMDAGRVVGVISEGDIDSALPSKATSLSVNELTYLVNKLAIAKVMSRDPITIGPDALLEQAAVVMREAKIEMLPVVEGDRLVGVITESDLLDAFIEIMGSRDHGTRLVVEAPDVPGALARLGSVTGKHGANIQHLAVYRGSGGTSDVVVGVNTADSTEIEADLTEAGFTVRGRLHQ
ncbi:MAG TPA: CBS domain-containing protein [Propionibacterium sp.]|nr:CBS domain-containing protein [Propionibacterium sp.]